MSEITQVEGEKRNSKAGIIKDVDRMRETDLDELALS